MSAASEQIRKLESEVTTLKLQQKHFQRQLSIINSWKWSTIKAAATLPVLAMVFYLLKDPNAVLNSIYATLVVLVVVSVLHIFRSRLIRDR